MCARRVFSDANFSACLVRITSGSSVLEISGRCERLVRGGKLNREEADEYNR